MQPEICYTDRRYQRFQSLEERATRDRLNRKRLVIRAFRSLQECATRDMV